MAFIIIRTAKIRRVYDYCKEVWDFSRQRAYQLIDSAGVVENVHQGGQIEQNETYYKERWGFRRDYADRLIAYSNVIDILTPMGGKIPETERQTRPLVKLGPTQQREAWQKAVEKANSTRNNRRSGL